MGRRRGASDLSAKGAPSGGMRFEVPVGQLLEQLLQDPAMELDGGVAAVHREPAKPARSTAWPAGVSQATTGAAARLGIELPYVHQARALEAAIDPDGPGALAIVTGTASGKSACYTLPLVEAAVRSGGSARGLLIFPTKALAHDQLAHLRRWDQALDGACELSPAAYDGDTPRGARSGIRRSARLLLTNPDMLHGGILPHHTAWASFFSELAWIVVDEAHVYRGVFGGHVANVLRRLRRVAGHYGARPRCVLTSATLANPGDLAAALAGEPALIIDDDGAPRGARTFVLYNPPIIDERLGVRRSSLLEAERLARHFVAGGVQTIVFARTRRTAELMVRYIGDGLSREGLGTGPVVGTGRKGKGAADGDGGGPERLVRGYRGGYTPAERRAIEADLRDGRLRAVVATNALELGIDIGDLDACVMVGYPGTIASTRQQAGRAGRRRAGSAAVLVVGPGPLDQFLAGHPEFLFERSVERALLDPDNPLLLLDHVRCAAFELPFDADEAAGPFGAAVAGAPSEPSRPRPAVAEVLAVLEEQGWVRRYADGRWYWLADAYPAQTVGLRAAGADGIAVVRSAPPNEILGTVDRGRAPSEVHPGAVYLHDGSAWRVLALDWDAGRAEVVPENSDVYTQPTGRTTLQPLEIAEVANVPAAALHRGQLEVRRRITGFRELRLRTREVVRSGTLDMPETSYAAGACWFVVEEAALDRLRASGTWRHDPLAGRGPGWQAARDDARARDGYRCRSCGAPEAPDRQHDVHHVRPFRDFLATGAPPGPAAAESPESPVSGAAGGTAEGAARAAAGTADGRATANDLDNLVTLCRSCHARAEGALALQGGLSGVGYALRHIAPLFLMCDPSDLDVSAESRAAWTGGPTVALYEASAIGAGFGGALFDLHGRIVNAALELIQGCPCEHGCPACIGPVLDESDGAKPRARAILELLRDERVL